MTTKDARCAGGGGVLVLERHYEAGGFTHAFCRPGYQWDVGLHYIGQVGELPSQERRIFDYVTAGALAWQPMPAIYDRILIDDQRFDFASGAEALREGLRQAFPSETTAIIQRDSGAGPRQINGPHVMK